VKKAFNFISALLTSFIITLLLAIVYIYFFTDKTIKFEEIQETFKSAQNIFFFILTYLITIPFTFNFKKIREWIEKKLNKIKTTIGVSAIILNHNDEILLITTKKDGKNFYEQPGTKYEFLDFKKDLIAAGDDSKKFTPPIEKLVNNINTETGINIDQLNLIDFIDYFNNFFGKKVFELNLKTEGIPLELEFNNLHKKYRDNRILPPPFLIETQYNNNPRHKKISTVDMWYAFQIDENVVTNNNVVWKTKEEITYMIASDKDENISIHHDLQAVLVYLDRVLSQSKPKIIYAKCSFLPTYLMTEDRQIKHMFTNSSNSSPLANDIIVIKKDTASQGNSNIQYFKQIFSLLDRQLVILNIDSIPQINEQISSWTFFNDHNNKIDIIKVYYSDDLNSLSQIKKDFKNHYKTFEYVVDFQTLQSKYLSIMENIKKHHIKQLFITYENTTEANNEIHSFINKLNTDEEIIERYSCLNTISFKPKGCNNNTCELHNYCKDG
jgi:hypothetical protein